MHNHSFFLPLTILNPLFIMTSIRIILWFLLSSSILPLIVTSNSTKISRIQDLSFFQQIQEFAKWEEENLFKPKSLSFATSNTTNNTTRDVSTFHSNITNRTFVLPIVNQYFNKSSKLLNISFFAQGKGKSKKPNWTVTSGFFADKEVEDDGREEECCFPIREIPVAKPPPRPKAPKPKPKMKYNPPPEYWPQPGTWSDSSSSDDNDEESSSWSDGSLSDESCSDDDGGGGNKLWFLGFNAPPVEKRVSIIPSSKLVTRVSDEFHNLYIDPQMKQYEKRNYMEEYQGFDEDLDTNNEISYGDLYDSSSNNIIGLGRKWTLFLFSLL